MEDVIVDADKDSAAGTVQNTDARNIPEPNLGPDQTSSDAAGESEMSTSEKIHENVQSYVRGDADVKFITTNRIFQEFELQAKECLRKNYVQKNNEIAEIMRVTASTLLGMDPDFLEMPLCDLIRDADYPDTLEELFEKMDSGEVWKRQLELEEEADQIAEANLRRAEEAAKNVIDDDQWETEDEEAEVKGKSDDEANLTAETEPELFHSENESESERLENSPELFATPRSSKDVPPVRKLGRAKKSKNQNMIGPLVGLRFPSSQRSSFADAPPVVPTVFQFQGVVVNKEPRTMKPGEVFFSATGSPIVPSDTIATLFPSNTPIRKVGRPICVTVDNADGTSVEVELVRRGRPSNVEEAQVFREFVTDVRGLITTRSAMNFKLMASRVPNSGSRKKPVWKL